MVVSRLGVSLILLASVACGTNSETQNTSTGAEEADGVMLVGSHANLKLQVPARADEPFSVMNKRFGAEVHVRVDGALSAPRSGGSGEWTYRDAFGAGNDLVLREAANGLEDWVRLETPGRVAYRVALGANIAGLRSLGSVVEFLDAKGTPVLRVGNAFAIDHLGARAALAFGVEGCEVDSDPRMPWGRPVREPGARECVLAVEVPSGMTGPIWVDPLWETTDDLNVARWGAHLAIAGVGAAARVLAIGGTTGDLNAPPSDVVESFDPDTMTWTQVLPLGYTALDGRAVTLADGRVLMIGGESGPGTVANARLFNPATSTWSDAASMTEPRRRHTATVLLDGRVLVAGGSVGNTSSETAEVYNPTLNSWTMTANMTSPRAEAAAVRLPDGKVLVTGGYGGSSFPRDSSELWNPAANAGLGAFEPEIVMPGAIYAHAMALWGSDRVIVAGGESAFFFGLATLDQVYDIASKSWSDIAAGSNRGYAGIESLADGSAVVFGGCSHNTSTTSAVPCVDPLSSVRLYPANGNAPIDLPSEVLTLARGRMGWVTMPDGRVMAAGGSGEPADAMNRTDIFALYPNGTECVLGNVCTSGFCVDGVCCESACNGVCESCGGTVIGTAGQCVAHATGSDPDDECINDGALCEQTGECGESGCEMHTSNDCELSPCQNDSDCSSGFCSDDICCDAECDENCASCRATDTGEAEGECHPILPATDPAGECVDGAAGDCTSQLLCDGAYQCISAGSLCAPYACSDQGCNESCDDNDACADGFACVGGECVPSDTLCTDETMGLQPDGTVVNCAPFRCQADGTCYEVCESLEQCEPGLVCDDADASCVDPPSSGGDEGCVCTTSTLQGGSLRSLAPWLLLLVATRRWGRQR